MITTQVFGKAVPDLAATFRFFGLMLGDEATYTLLYFFLILCLAFSMKGIVRASSGARATAGALFAADGLRG